ncbi:hypothetical protein RUM43_000234 [Polyplax serrata]|uniref:Uncharacterized protein n=1 Tax=Polyplax serrata TaxID=468196 RepID=A0AAN8SDJ6_POLSC
MVITCKKPCKRKRSTMLTVEQMVDIALGTPEIGAVNFNVLHALIHVIIQQLNIQKCLVEFKGYDSERMEGIILSAKPVNVQ